MPQVSVPIIDQLLHPSLGLLTHALVPGGPFSGDFSLTPPQNPLVALTYGIQVSFFTIPGQLGVVVGNPTLQRDSIVQVSAVHTLLDGHSVIDEMVFFHWDGAMYFWTEPLPDHLDLHVFPGCVVNFNWLQT